MGLQSGVMYFLGNILLAWAMIQQPYMSKTLLSPPPQNKNEWVHSVIFEPQPKMQLTRSSHIIFRFSTFSPGIPVLIVDIDNPTYFGRLISPFHDVSINPFLMNQI